VAPSGGQANLIPRRDHPIRRSRWKAFAAPTNVCSGGYRPPRADLNAVAWPAWQPRTARIDIAASLGLSRPRVVRWRREGTRPLFAPISLKADPCTILMRHPTVLEPFVVSREDRRTLDRWVRMPTAPQRLVLRSRIVLLLADGYAAREVARRLGVSRPTVALWRRRYAEEGCHALTRDRPGRGRKANRQSDAFRDHLGDTMSAVGADRAGSSGIVALDLTGMQPTEGRPARSRITPGRSERGIRRDRSDRDS
jgi:hypothetical protein